MIKKKVVLLSGIFIFVFLSSCGHTIKSKYIWKPKGTSAQIDLTAGLILTDEFKEYVFEYKYGDMGAQYDFVYLGKTLANNLPKSLSAVFKEIKVFSSLTDAKNKNLDLIIKPQIPILYMKIGWVEYDFPMTIDMKTEVYDAKGDLFYKGNVKGEYLGETETGNTIAAYSFPCLAMPIMLNQFEKSQDGAIGDLLNKLNNKLISERETILLHVSKH